MREGWKSAKLGEVSEMIKRGIAPKYIDAGGVCVINQKCIRDHSINYDLARRHNIDVKKVSQERFIQLGDVLVNSTGTGTLGRVAQVRREPNEPATVDTHVTIVRPVDGLFYNDFFGYMLIKIENEITSSGEGASGQTELARSKLENQFVVSFPQSIVEQKRIVAILDEAFSGIDVAISNSKKNLANARELFESYLNAVFSQRGEGWVTKPLGVCFRLKSGDALTSKQMRPGEFPVFGGNGIAGRHNQSNLSGSNVIVGRVGALCGNARHINESIWLTDNAFKVVDKRCSLDDGFLVCLLNACGLRRYARQSAQPVISNSSLKDIDLSFPEAESEQRKIAGQLDELKKEIRRVESVYQQKLTALAELKQSLLHKAFSGELTAERVEAAVDEATP